MPAERSSDEKSQKAKLIDQIINHEDFQYSPNSRFRRNHRKSLANLTLEELQRKVRAYEPEAADAAD